MSSNIKLGLISYDLVYCPIQYVNKVCVKGLAKVTKDKTFYKDNSIVTLKAGYEVKVEESKIFIHGSEESHQIRVGGNTILLTREGIVIRSDKVVHIDAGLHVTGEVLIGGSLSVSKSISVDENVDVKERMRDSFIREGVVIPPNIPLDELKAKAPSLLKKIFADGVVSEGKVDVAVAVGNGLAAPLEAAGEVDVPPAGP